MPGYHFDPQNYKELQNIVDFASDMVATPFDASKSYAVGEYCRRESGFYVRNTAGSGAWDASKWTPTTVGDVLKAANAEISALNATLTQFINGFSIAPTAPTAYNSRAGTIEGGYIQIGNVVIVAVRFIALTANSSAAVYLQGLPRPNATIVLTGGLPNNNANVLSYVNASGQIGLGAVSANTQATVMGVYLAS